MSVRSFIDTNILVYSRDLSEKTKGDIARRLISEIWNDRTGRISIQVCNEYFVTVTRKLSQRMSEQEAWEDVEDLMAWDPVPVDQESLQVARHVQLRYHLSWWDSLIIASASMAGCGKIYTEDLNHGQDYLGIKVINPFL